MKISAILFDLDGTLIDSAPVLMISWSMALSEVGIKVRPEDLRKYVGLAPKTIVSQFIKDPSDELVRMLKEIRKNYYIKNIDKVVVFDDARFLLEEAKRLGIKMALATSMGNDLLNEIVVHTSLDKYLCCWVSAEEVARPKPEPDVFLKALEKAGAEKSSAIGVGDREYDIIALRKAEIYSVLVERDEYSITKEVEPDLRVKSLTELVPLIQSNR
ncbi:MAG: HAD family hydrolase [Nitrososphaeria archaeon]